MKQLILKFYVEETSLEFETKSFNRNRVILIFTITWTSYVLNNFKNNPYNLMGKYHIHRIPHCYRHNYHDNYRDHNHFSHHS